MRCVSKFWSILFLSLVPVSIAVAHPHVWIETSAEVVIEEAKVVGLWQEWTFDEMFSNIVILDYDRNQNGQFEADESETIRREYFSNLSNFHYFTFVYSSGKSQPIREVKNFRATLKKGTQVVYRFYVPLSIPLVSGKTFSFAIYDESFYSDMVFQKSNPVTAKVGGKGKASLAIAPNKARAFYGGQVVPTEVTLQWENGL